MSATLVVEGLRDMNREFKNMMEIKLLCKKYKVSYPTEVSAYFGNNVNENEEYVTEEMTSIELPLIDWKNDNREGYELNVSEIPKECTTIRCYLSY